MRTDCLRIPRAASRPPGGWIVAGLATAAIAGAGLVLYAFEPTRESFFPRCPFHSLTGLHSPGCGSTRALHEVLHGRLLAALDYNAFLVIAMPFLAYGLISAGLEISAGRSLPRVFIPAAWIWTLLGAIALYAVLRNLPFEPFRVLAP